MINLDYLLPDYSVPYKTYGARLEVDNIYEEQAIIKAMSEALAGNILARKMLGELYNRDLMECRDSTIAEILLPPVDKFKAEQAITEDKVDVNDKIYSSGRGGLYSTEKNVFTKDVINIDITSYYPCIIANVVQDKAFLEIYKGFIEKRLVNRTNGDPYKIIINGAYGKMGEYGSQLENQKLRDSIAIKGQKVMLDIIKRLENIGIEVLSCNTDGLIVRASRPIKLIKRLVTNALNELLPYNKGLSIAYYEKAFMVNVNNNLLIGECVKASGEFRKHSIRKNPNGYIVYKAIKDYFANGTQVEETISNCQNIHYFMYCSSINDNSSFEQNGKMLDDKFIRWVYSKKGSEVKIFDNKRGSYRKLNKAENALIQNITTDISDVDKEHYIVRANELIEKMKG